ncbi:MAG: septal ring lytic transglycosylase RlpA family protein [Burkholderiaceae bacterium]
MPISPSPGQRPSLLGLVAVLGGLLAGCAGLPAGPAAPGRPAIAGDASGRDGPPASPPPDLAQVPDAEPRIEPIRLGGPNKPYEVLGRSYVPMTQDRPVTETGLASWYGRKFHGRRTASGEVYDMYAMTAAHPTLPLPSYVRVRNPANGREVVVRVNDRGPFHPGRVIDLSYTAALRLDLLRGVATVELERLTFEAIRSGAWRRDAPPALAQAAPTEPAKAAAIESAPIAALTPDPVPSRLAVPMLDAVAARPDELPSTALSGGVFVQLGAFAERETAKRLQRRVGADLDWLAPSLAVRGDAPPFRLQAGPYPSRDEARQVQQRIRAASTLLAPLIVERR